MPTPLIAAVLLAAGASRRLGRPKQDLLLAGQTLLDRALHTALAAGLTPIFVVVNTPDRLHPPHPPGVTPLLNPHAAQGMSTSIHLGVQHALHAAAPGLILLTCDQPLLRPEHLRALAADPTRITASAYANRHGVPAYFPAAAFPQLLTLTGDQGARNLLQQAHAILEESLALDIDTEADLHRAQQLSPTVQTPPKPSVQKPVNPPQSLNSCKQGT